MCSIQGEFLRLVPTTRVAMRTIILVGCENARSHQPSVAAMTPTTRPPVPPFDETSARAKVLAAEAAWNTRDPERVAGAYTVDSVWRNRSEFIQGRDQIVEFLRAKWERELDYALRKDLWAFHDNRIAVRFQYEWHDHDGNWFRSYGNENWEFDDARVHAPP